MLTIGRLIAPSEPRAESGVEVVKHYAWTGVPHASLHRTLVALLSEWRVARIVIDATGIGEPVAAFLARALGPSRVEPVKLTADSKSRLGYGLLAAVNGGRLRLYGRGRGGAARVPAAAGAVPGELQAEPADALPRRRAGWA